MWRAIVVLVHLLGGGVWIGAVGFNVFVLHPRAERFFATPTKFEDFVFTVVAGMRWWVVAGVSMLALAGAELWRLRGLALDPVLALKIALLATNAIIFAWLSWRMWPARVVATAAELDAIHRRFTRVGALMVSLNLLNVVLGVWHHVVRDGR